MKKSLFKIALGCAACSIWFAAPVQAGSQTDQQNDQSQNSYSSSSERTSDSTKSWKSHSSRTGHLIRASRLTGADVNDSSGSRIGRIEDILINPQSGRIDFAVLSLNASGGASSPSGYNSGSSSSRNNSSMGQNSESSSSTSSLNSGGTADTASSSSDSSYSSSNGRLVPVPWSLLRPASSSSSYSSGTSSSSSSEQHAFTLNINRSKLDQAPTLDRGNWSDTSQSDWRQRVYSYYGVSGEYSAGSAESPSGVSQGQGAERLTGQENSPPSSSQNP